MDTKTALTTLGSEAAPGALNVPAGTSKLLGAHVSLGCDYVAVGSASAIVRLEGGGMKEGPETFAAGGAGGESTTGNSALQKSTFVPLGVGVTPGNEVLIYGEMCGEDVGSLHFGVTLVFQ